MLKRDLQILEEKIRGVQKKFCYIKDACGQFRSDTGGEGRRALGRRREVLGRRGGNCTMVRNLVRTKGISFSMKMRIRRPKNSPSDVFSRATAFMCLVP